MKSAPATLLSPSPRQEETRETKINQENLHDKLGRFLHDLRISVIDQCNFRCPYCMPDEKYAKHTFLENTEWLSFDEIVRLVTVFTRLGVSKVRITGGEPLLRQNLVDLIKRLREISAIKDLALTTNGSLLGKYAQQLKSAGIDRITVSLDSLDEKTFRHLSGNRSSVGHILSALDEAQRAGFDSIKINAVIIKGVNDANLLDLVRHFRRTKHILRFIEYMDVGNENNWRPELVVSSRHILSRIHVQFPVKPIAPNYDGEVAVRYAYEDGKGEIGFISSITQPFCTHCTRARISADGKLYTCLFAEKGIDLRQELRCNSSDEKLFTVIKNIWKNRTDRYSEERFSQNSQHQKLTKVEMYKIGG